MLNKTTVILCYHSAYAYRLPCHNTRIYRLERKKKDGGMRRDESGNGDLGNGEEWPSLDACASAKSLSYEDITSQLI